MQYFLKFFLSIGGLPCPAFFQIRPAPPWVQGQCCGAKYGRSRNILIGPGAGKKRTGSATLSPRMPYAGIICLNCGGSESSSSPWLSPRMPWAGLTCLNCGGSESSSSLSISQNALCKISFTCRSSPLSGLCIERKKQWDLVGIEHDVRTSVPEHFYSRYPCQTPVPNKAAGRIPY